MSNQALLLIDGFNLLSRGYFATSYGRTDEQLQKSSKGVYTNALRIFFQKTFNLISDHNISHIAVAWDVKREDTARRQKYDFYKGTRNELPTPLIEQYEVCTDVLEAIGIKQYAIVGYEADDIIGTLSSKWCRESRGAGYIYSNDKDLFQLLSPNISQIVAKKKEELIYSLDHFQSEYGITSKQWVDVKALLGDSSDNIPGCPGIGEKSALPLIQEYGSVEAVFDQLEDINPKFNRYKKKLHDGKESTLISKELSEIICSIEEVSNLNFEDLILNICHDTLQSKLLELELKIKL